MSYSSTVHTACNHKAIDPTHWLRMYDVQIVLNYTIKALRSTYQHSYSPLENFMSKDLCDIEKVFKMSHFKRSHAVEFI